MAVRRPSMRTRKDILGCILLASSLLLAACQPSGQETGAAAVQVGTATFTDPMAIPRIVRALERLAAEEGIRDLGACTGTLSDATGPSRTGREANGNQRT